MLTKWKNGVTDNKEDTKMVSQKIVRIMDKPKLHKRLHINLTLMQNMLLYHKQSNVTIIKIIMDF